MKNIISAPMNQVYSREYIEACIDADITPGVFFARNSTIPSKDLIDFGNYLYVSVVADRIMKIDFRKSGFKIIEILGFDTVSDFEKLLIRVEQLLDAGIRVVFKKVHMDKAPTILCKGAEAAGLPGDKSLKDVFIQAKSLYPYKDIIVSGGIHSPKQVKYYLDNGAIACAIGTLFASCKESPLCLEAKKILVKANYYHTKKFPQNGLQLSNFNKTEFNNTKELHMGVTTGKKGIIYAGRALDFIKEIRPLKDIVNDLRSEL